jgi:hypothetical protein
LFYWYNEDLYDRVSRDHEEKLGHQDSQVKKERREFRDLPAILVHRERKEIRARKARTATLGKREIG